MEKYNVWSCEKSLLTLRRKCSLGPLWSMTFAQIALAAHLLLQNIYIYFSCGNVHVFEIYIQLLTHFYIYEAQPGLLKIKIDRWHKNIVLVKIHMRGHYIFAFYIFEKFYNMYMRCKFFISKNICFEFDVHRIYNVRVKKGCRITNSKRHQIIAWKPYIFSIYLIKK